MKYLKIIFALLLFAFCVSGCSDDDKSGILFNNAPITVETVTHYTRDFTVGEKIYYLFYTPKKITSEFIRVQIFKASDVTGRGGYSIIMTNDYRVMKHNVYYYTNDFTINLPGRYVMQIFPLDNLSEPLAWNFFYVR